MVEKDYKLYGTKYAYKDGDTFIVPIGCLKD